MGCDPVSAVSPSVQRRVVFAIERQARGAKRGPRACPSEGVVRCIRHHSREPPRGMQSERAGWTGVVFLLGDCRPICRHCQQTPAPLDNRQRLI